MAASSAAEHRAGSSHYFREAITMGKKPWENSSGYYDPTAYAGEKEIGKEEQRVSALIGCIKYIAKLAGFEILNRIELRDVKSRRTYR